MIIKKYNAICNLGQNIDEIYKEAILGNNRCFDYTQNYRLALVKTDLPTINNEIYNLRCNQLLLKALEPIDTESLDKKSTAIVVATTNSGVEEYETSKNPKHFQIGNPAEFLHNHFGFKNYYTSISTACSSGIKAFGIAKEIMELNIAKTVIVAGVDSIAKLPILGFDSLKILSKEPTVPFSQNRAGINIGEGAAVFIVEKNGNGVEISGIGETTDFYHSTTPNPDGKEAKKAIEQALNNINPADIDYINLHGTGTQANDLMEAKTISEIFGNKVPASSTKPLTGHCLGAAASIEAALCCKLLDSNTHQVFPHVYDNQYNKTLPKILLADNTPQNKIIKTCLSISFGFGGTNCAMVLRKQTQNTKL